jgi:hypothetical protein
VFVMHAYLAKGIPSAESSNTQWSLWNGISRQMIFVWPIRQNPWASLVGNAAWNQQMKFDDISLQ